MRKKLRKIVVNNKHYLWKLSSKWDNIWHTHLTIYSTSGGHKYHIIFRTTDYYHCGNPLNEGCLIKKENKQASINLNQPKYIAEIISFLNTHPPSASLNKTEYHISGNKLLIQMGYVDEHNLFRQSDSRE